MRLLRLLLRREFVLNKFVRDPNLLSCFGTNARRRGDSLLARGRSFVDTRFHLCQTGRFGGWNGGRRVVSSLAVRDSELRHRRAKRWSVNIKKGTAAVMRTGCRRGEFFEGCERRGKRDDPPIGFGQAGFGISKRDEPHGRKWDAISPQPSCGETHRGGEKPRGWNGTGACRSAKAEGVLRSIWSGHKNGKRRRGTLDESHERMDSNSACAVWAVRFVRERIEGTAKCMRAASHRFGGGCR